MFIDDRKEEAQYMTVKKRVEELKKFYKHLTVYIVINLFISAMKIRRNLGNGETLEEAIFDFNTFAVWIFWGIAIVIQAFKLFGLNFMFGRDWEERKIRKYMERDNFKSNNFK